MCLHDGEDCCLAGDGLRVPPVLMTMPGRSRRIQFRVWNSVPELFLTLLLKVCRGQGHTVARPCAGSLLLLLLLLTRGRTPVLTTPVYFLSCTSGSEGTVASSGLTAVRSCGSAQQQEDPRTAAHSAPFSLLPPWSLLASNRILCRSNCHCSRRLRQGSSSRVTAEQLGRSGGGSSGSSKGVPSWSWGAWCTRMYCTCNSNRSKGNPALVGGKE